MPTGPKTKPLPKAIKITAPPALRITSDEALQLATQALHALDGENIGRMIEIAGPPPLRMRNNDLASLIWIIVSQQVSTASARSIFARLQEKFANMHHAELFSASDEDLRLCGLSAPKMRTIRNICATIDKGGLDLSTLALKDAGEIRQALTSIKGIGPWTADIYLLFCVGHPDVWPAGDLALQEGVKMALGLRKRPDAARLEKISRRWQPYRAVAARLVWAYYGRVLEMRKQDGNSAR